MKKVFPQYKLIIILGIAAILGIIVAIEFSDVFLKTTWFQTMRLQGNTLQPPSPSVALTIDPNAGELITPSPAPTEPGVAIEGWSRIIVPAHSLEAAVSLHNPEENEGWYYLTYELRLKKPENAPTDEPEEVIFTTGLIPPGLYCNKVMLTRELEAGVYPAILHVQPYRMNEEMSPTNNADLELLLVVK